MQSTIQTNNCRQAAEILRKVGYWDTNMSVMTSGKTAIVSYLDGNGKLQMEDFPLGNEGTTRITQSAPTVPRLSGIRFTQGANAGQRVPNFNVQIEPPACELLEQAPFAVTPTPAPPRNMVDVAE